MQGRFIVTRREGIALCVASTVFVVICDRIVIGLGWGQAVLSAERWFILLDSTASTCTAGHAPVGPTLQISQPIQRELSAPRGGQVALHEPFEVPRAHA